MDELAKTFRASKRLIKKSKPCKTAKQKTTTPPPSLLDFTVDTVMKR